MPKAVAEVVLQRTHERDYPSTVCGVTYDGVQPYRRDCQFSFACDATLRRPREGYAWQRVRVLAEKILIGAVREFCRGWKNQTEVTVPGSHFIQEDSGPAIGRAVADWIKAKAI